MNGFEQSDDSSPPGLPGFTLIELMVVVAIIGVLAALAIGAYTSQLDKGRITQLKEYAMEVEKGQHEYSSRNGRFFTPTNQVYTTGDDEWEELLAFNHDTINPDTRVITEAGLQGQNCGICPPNMTPDTTENWYAVVVCRDLDGTTAGGQDCSQDTTVYLDNRLDSPMVLREGQ